MSHSPDEFNFGDIVNSFFPKVNEAVRNVASIISRDNPIRPTKSNSDPYSSTAVSYQDLSNSNNVYLGIVAEVLPFYGWYKVISFNGGHAVVCNLMSDCSNTPIGARRIGSIQPHTKVHYIKPYSGTTGTIIGVEPDAMPYMGDVIPEVISMATNFFTTAEGTNNSLTLFDKECLGDFSRGSPVDSTLVGERGWVCETGTAIFIDPFMSFIKSDENCGFWAFHFDQVARMQGHNIQIRSCAHEQEFFNDTSECVGYVGYATYPWEGLGALESGTRTAQLKDDGYTDAAKDIGLETQVPYHRLQSFTGYLGQGFRQFLRLPPEGGGINELGKRGGDIAWEQHLALDGNYHIRSSQGITIAHSPLYKSPARVRRMEDEESGDTKDNYKFSGSVGGGEDHKITDTPIDAQEFPARVLIADDDVAYSFAWRNEHPFVYHQNDFITYEDPEAEDSPAYGQLSGQWYITPPTGTTKKVDHRYDAKYNNLLSYFKIMPDGAIVIAGPHGEEIRMVGGSIEISCPGDIQLRPGRNLISLAGRSTAIRSKEDIDVSSTDADVRLKAEKNTMILAGNGKSEGNLIIENKSSVEKGIVLRSAGGINLLSVEDLYLRSGADGSARNVIIDAGSEGSGDVCISSERMGVFVNQGRYDFFGSPGAATSSNSFTGSTTVTGSPIYADGDIGGLGNLICKRYVIAVEGHIATGQAKTFNYFVGELSDKVDDSGTSAKQKAEASLEQIKEYVEKINKLGDDLYEAFIKNPFTEGGQIGDADTSGGWGKNAFKFKSTGEYKATAFKLYESRWQQRDRLFGGGGSAWTENPVVYLGEDTYPYPGRQAWTEDPSMKEVDLMFYNLKPSQRIEDQKNPGSENGTPPDGNYKIIG